MMGAYPKVKYLNGASFVKVLALPANSRQGKKGFPERNTLAYYENL